MWITEDCAALCFGLHDDPVDYCKALRQVIEASSTPERLKALWGRNSVTIEMLRPNLRDLRTQVGELEEGRRTARGRRDAERLARGYSGADARANPWPNAEASLHRNRPEAEPPMPSTQPL